MNMRARSEGVAEALNLWDRLALELRPRTVHSEYSGRMWLVHWRRWSISSPGVLDWVESETRGEVERAISARFPDAVAFDVQILWARRL